MREVEKSAANWPIQPLQQTTFSIAAHPIMASPSLFCSENGEGGCRPCFIPRFAGAGG